MPSEASWNLGWAQAWLMRPCTNSFTSLGLSFHFYKMGINTAFLRMFFERIKQFFGGGVLGVFVFWGLFCVLFVYSAQHSPTCIGHVCYN